MSDSYDTGSLPSPYRRKDELTANQQWLFGGLFAGLLLIGFAFGLYAGAPPKTKATELADAKGKELSTVAPRPAPPVTPPAVKKDEPKKTEHEPEPVKPEPVKPEPKKTEPEPKKPDPEPKKPDPPAPKKTEPEPKKPNRVVAFKEVQPILAAYCNNCHGAAGKIKGGVDLRTLAAITKGDESGNKLVVPGNPEKSPLYESITAGRMPENGKPPNAEQMALLRDWILGGAK
jgi:outer membrane biosynthesis protein TonB